MHVYDAIHVAAAAPHAHWAPSRAIFTFVINGVLDLENDNLDPPKSYLCWIWRMDRWHEEDYSVLTTGTSTPLAILLVPKQPLNLLKLP